MNKNSNTFSNSKLPVISLLVFSTIFIFFFYGKVLLNPDAYLFSSSGDGIKNYFTYASHINNDSSWLISEGMNYPYGEHFLYTDCHPVLTIAMRCFSPYSEFLRDHPIGILNFLMIISIFLSFYVTYFLLRAFKITRWLSFIFAISITLLAPQIFRLGGHYALSYSLAIPLSWLLLERFYQLNKPYKYFVLLLLNNLFWLFIHAYLGVIILFFLLAIVVFRLTFNHNNKKQYKIFFASFVAVALPLMFYYLFTVITDPYTGRTDNPSGFFLYNAELDDIFLPHHPPLRPLFDLLSGHSINLKWEAWSYVGFAGTVLFLFLTISFFVCLIRGKIKTFAIKYFGNSNINISLLAAFVVLLFAMGIPFVQFPDLLDGFPFLKQFRATGRFAWPFYFAFLVFSASVFQRWVQQSGKPLFVYLIVGAIFLLNITEALPYHRKASSNITRSLNLFQKEQLPENFREAIQSIQTQDYQAIITLPFYYYGSESFARPRIDEAVRTSLVFSYHSGIPNVCTSLTRTPIQASKNIVQLMSPAFYPKTIQTDITSEKPFLIIQTQKKLTGYENKLLEKATLIRDFDDFSLHTLKPKDLFANTASHYFDLYQANLPKLFQKNGFMISDSTAFLFYNDFENHKNNTTFRGLGSYQGEKKGKNTFAEFTPGIFEPGKAYHFSMWMHNGKQDALNLWFRFLVEEWSPATEEWHTTTFFPEQSEVIYGDWSLVEGDFSILSGESHVYFASKGKENSKADLFADDLLITTSGTEIFKIHNDTLFYNNHEVILP